MHHIISDAWSKDVIIKEFIALYSAFCEGRKNPLTAMRIQHKDYAQWHIDQLSGENLERHRSFWLNQFKGKIPVLELPTDYPRPKLKSFAGKYVYFSLNKGIAGHLKRISLENGSTLFMTILAVVNVFLYKYTGQTDIIIGTPVAGREHKDLENQIGFYVNMLALRNKLKKEWTFGDVLQAVKHNTLQAFEHQVYPFDLLASELNVVRDISHNPLFDVVVTSVTGNTRRGDIDDFVESGLGTSKHDLRMRFIDHGNQITVHIQYNPDLFKEERISIVRERFISLITNIIPHIDLEIDNLEFQIEFEKKQPKKKFRGGF